MIDGVPLKFGCTGSRFLASDVIDFYIINLTMDDHPIHIHLVNFQIIRRFRFDVNLYKRDWEARNGFLRLGGVTGLPTQIDVRAYMIANTE